MHKLESKLESVQLVCDRLAFIFTRERGVRRNSISRIQVQSLTRSSSVLPKPKNTRHNLRRQVHNLALPADVSATTEQNFVHKMLF